MYGLASTFDAWGDNLVTSTEFKISKVCIDKLGTIDSEELTNNIINASKNNIIIKNKNLKTAEKNIISINQCILLINIKVLYLTYNTFYLNTNKVIKISLTDNRGNIIAENPSLVDTTRSSLIHNYENYFWGIDFDKYETIYLHIEVYSLDNKLLYEYDQLIV